ncbi:hypothetical protein GW17_00060189 [Ensete ventricosum]|nr:hypothetical protein GW17_00060189 [Ensete ventricosum]
MIERAEFPVQRKSTLKTCSGMGFLPSSRALRRTAWRREFRDERLAEFSAAAAAIFDEIKRHRAQPRELGAIDHRSALPRAPHEPGARQNVEMGRQRILRHAELLCQFALRQAVRLMPHKQPEGIEPGRLRQRCKREDRFFSIHISRITDITG